MKFDDTTSSIFIFKLFSYANHIFCFAIASSNRVSFTSVSLSTHADSSSSSDWSTSRSSWSLSACSAFTMASARAWRTNISNSCTWASRFGDACVEPPQSSPDSSTISSSPGSPVSFPCPSRIRVGGRAAAAANNAFSCFSAILEECKWVKSRSLASIWRSLKTSCCCNHTF